MIEFLKSKWYAIILVLVMIGMMIFMVSLLQSIKKSNEEYTRYTARCRDAGGIIWPETTLCIKNDRIIKVPAR